MASSLSMCLMGNHPQWKQASPLLLYVCNWYSANLRRAGKKNREERGSAGSAGQGEGGRRHGGGGQAEQEAGQGHQGARGGGQGVAGPHGYTLGSGDTEYFMSISHAGEKKSHNKIILGSLWSWSSVCWIGKGWKGGCFKTSLHWFDIDLKSASSSC